MLMVEAAHIMYSVYCILCVWELSKHWLPVDYHIHIWQVSLHLSCNDTCLIWMRFKGPKYKLFAKIKIVSYRQSDKGSSNLSTTLNKSRRLQLPPHLKLSKEASVTPTPDLVCLPVTCSLSWTPEREIKFIGLFEDRGHRGPYCPYKPFNHNLYIGIIIFPHIDNPMVWQYHIQCTVFKLK